MSSLVSMKSTTYLMSGMVIELSAMLVATITFRFPSSFEVVLNALSYSSLYIYFKPLNNTYSQSDECKGTRSNVSRTHCSSYVSLMNSMNSNISCRPGKNTNTLLFSPSPSSASLNRSSLSITSHMIIAARRIVQSFTCGLLPSVVPRASRSRSIVCLSFLMS